MRLQYDEARRKLSNLKVCLANIEDQMIPGQSQCDKDSSRGSLNSLSTLDVYGQAGVTGSGVGVMGSEVNLQELHQRVEKLLQGHSMSPISETIATETASLPHADVTAAATNSYLQSVMAGSTGNIPNTVEDTAKTELFAASAAQSGMETVMVDGSAAGQACVADKDMVPGLVMSGIQRRAMVAGLETMDAISNPPLSPISESSSGVGNNLSGGNTRSVSAAVSDESVAGDSGVFEATVKRYEGVDKQLLVGLEQARNLAALPFPEGSKVCIKVAVVPSVNVSWATKPVSELKAPKFAEVFAVTLAEHRLYTNTIQLNVWSLHEVLGDECLSKSLHPTVLSLKEESSDESTIISSQTSTLTRNQGPEDMESHAFDPRLPSNDHDKDEEDDDVEEEDEKDYTEMIQEVLDEFAQLSADNYYDDHFTESDESPQANGLMVTGGGTARLPVRTSLDLELDRQAFHTRLTCLQDETSRLRQLKQQLEEAKKRGEAELPGWLVENEQFNALIAEAEKLVSRCEEKQHRTDQKVYLSKQDRRAEHLMKRVARDVQRMRQGSQKSRALSFREKMAFFTTVNINVPVIPREALEREDRTGEEFFNDDRVGEEV
nr:hypothetical protein BaRGS_007303 [Batillaria attramentaria]